MSSPRRSDSTWSALVDDLRRGPGFAVVRPEPGPDVAALTQLFELCERPAGESFVSSVHGTPEQARRIDLELKRLLSPSFEELLGDVEPFTTSLFVKPPHHGSPVQFHQDLTYTDERVERALLVWIPLHDVGYANGALSVVPGSHRWTTGIRGYGGPSPLHNLQQQVASLAEIVPLRRGEALLYDPALIHGSGPNTHGSERIAAIAAFAPRGAGLVHFAAGEGKALRGARVSESFFTSSHFGETPDGDELRPWADPVTEADVRPHIEAVQSTGVDTVSPTLDDIGRSNGERKYRHQAILRDLRRDGFVVFRLLDPEEAARCHEIHLAMHGGGTPTDAEESDLAAQYRRGLRRRLDAAVGARLDEALPGYRALAWDVLSAAPMSKAEPPHQPPPAVGQSTGGSRATVVVAMQDRLGHDGQFQVLRFSHLLESAGTRPPGGTDWSVAAPMIEPLLESVPLHAGECLLLDDALIRGRHPNHTSVEAVALRVRVQPVPGGVCPTTNQVVHGDGGQPAVAMTSPTPHNVEELAQLVGSRSTRFGVSRLVQWARR